ncbi:putative mfs sugar [Diplodia seriata]|uniref:Putative mfs sugar n=1 Tax=Diplodia seriata TaxID=420778 RepID=A0A0G2HE62_9PEZI|nr:putative mfs sugar [Diplodia seriata]
MGLWFNISLAVFAATGSFLFGYDSGVMTDVIQSPHFLNFFDTTKTSPIIGAINSTFSGGAVFGSLTGGLTMDRFGRKGTIIIGATVACVGAILQCAAMHLAMMLVGRILAGWAVGILSMSLIVGIAQQMIGVGFIVSTWIGYGSHHVPSTSSFSWHLLETDRDEEAMRVLRKLHYNGENDEWINREFHEIKTTIAAEKAITAPGWRIMFTVKQWRIRLMHATAVQVFTQMTGINVINYYQTLMYENLGIEGSRNLLVTGIYNCVGPLCNLIFITFFLDRFGRKKPLIFGSAAITLALICEAILNAKNPKGKSEGLSIGGVFFIFLVTCIFSFSFGPISWTYASEIMPMQIRARGSAFATGIGNWLVSTIWSQVSPIGLGAIGWKFYFVFIAWNIVVTLPCIIIFFKETKQLSLEEIDLLFGERALGQLPDNIHDVKVDPSAAEIIHQETKQ